MKFSSSFFLVNLTCLLFLPFFLIGTFSDQTLSNGSNRSEIPVENLALPVKMHRIESQNGQINVPLVGQNGQNLDAKKKQPQKFGTLFSWIGHFNQNGRVVKLYQKLKNTPGGWGQLLKKMYGEMLSAKKFGIGDSEPLRENCRRALQLIGEGRAVERVDVQKIAPFRDFWTLLKSSALSLIALFKGPSKTKNRENSRKRRTENILRTLKTFSEEDNSFFSRKRGKREDDGHKKQQGRRQKRLAPLIIFGIIIGGLMIIAFLSEWARAF